MIAIFAALNEEISSLRKELSISRSLVHQDCRLFESRTRRRNCLLVLTGMGQTRAQAAAEFVLKNHSLTAMISAGCSGALNLKATVGDIIVYTGLCCSEDNKSGQGQQRVLKPDQRLLSYSVKSLKQTGLPYLLGQGVSVDSVCVTPEAKAALGKELAADSVDMESYWLGCAAGEKKVPFITVRSVFDAVQDDLTCLSRISSDGKVNQGAAVIQALAHPGLIKNMVGYARNARKAEKNLAVFLNQLLEEIPE